MAMKSIDLRPGNFVESYGTNGNPTGWTKIKVTGEAIKTCEVRPDWFRPVKRLGLRLTDSQWDNVLLFWWGICGFMTCFILSKLD